MKNSAIEWTDHTFNPWIGCTKVSPGCAHCYAEARDQRFNAGKHWGKGAPRQRTTVSNWKQPLKWNEEMERRMDVLTPGMARIDYPSPRPRVFCASLADWLDDEVPVEWLADLLDIIRRTPNLDWQLLTKRPENWKPRLAHALNDFTARTKPTDGNFAFVQWLSNWLNGKPPFGVWIGTTVEDQQRAYERIPELLKIPAKVHFLSCEPLLGPVKLTHNVDWVICGGESGPHARPMHPDWARSLRDQCQAAGMPFFFKQWGEWIHDSGLPADAPITWSAYKYDSGTHSWRVGKHAAGRLLDRREHNDFPTP